VSSPGGEFQLGSAFVDVNLRDHTREDEARIRQRLESSDPVKFRVDVDRGSVTRAAQQARREFQSNVDKDKPKLGVAADRVSAREAGEDAAHQFRKGAEDAPSPKLRVTGDNARSTAAGGQAGRQAGQEFGRQAGLSISQSAKLWTGAILGATPLLGAAMAAGMVTAVIGMAAAVSSQSPAVRSAFRGLKDDAVAEINTLATATEGVFTRQIGIIDRSVGGLGSRIGASIQRAEPGIEQVTLGLTEMAGNALPGVLEMVERSEPAMAGMRSFMGATGRAVGNMGHQMAGVSTEVGQNWDTLGVVVERAMGLATKAMVGGTKAMAAHGGEIENTFNNIASTAEGLASGAMGPLGHEVEFLASTLNGLLTVVGPVSNVLGGMGGSLLGTLGIMRLIRRGSDGLTGSLTSLGSSGAAAGAGVGRANPAMGTFAQHMRDVRQEALSVGRPIGSVSAAITTLGQRAPAIGLARGAFLQASSGAIRFSRTAGVAAASGSLLKSGAIGLAGALGGPLGLALGAATVGLALLGDAQQAAADRSAESAEQTKSWTQALQDSNGSLSGAVRAQVMYDVGAQKMSDGTTSVIKGFKSLGLSSDEVFRAITQGGGALDGAHRKLDGLVNAMPPYLRNSVDAASRTGELHKTLNKLSGQFRDAEAAQRALTKAFNVQAAGTTNFAAAQAKLGDSVKGFADAAGDSEKRGQALGIVYDQLHGNALNLTGSQATLRESFDKLRDAGGGFGGVVDRNTGAINAFTDKGMQLTGIVMPLRNAFFSYADALTLAGKNTYEVSSRLQDARNSFVNAAVGPG
jgi:hypothetical protein